MEEGEEEKEKEEEEEEEEEKSPTISLLGGGREGTNTFPKNEKSFPTGWFNIFFKKIISCRLMIRRLSLSSSLCGVWHFQLSVGCCC